MSLRYRRSGAGKPLILIHGFLGSAGVWLAQETGLRLAFDVIAVDLPGFAGSSDENVPHTMKGFVAEIIALVDRLGLRTFSLIGWSFGGMIAQQAALDHPERIERLVLAGTAGVGELPQRFETWSETLSRLNSDGVVAALDRTVRTWFVSGEADPFFRTCREACAGATIKACVGAIDAMRSWRAIERLGDIRQRALVVVGDRDRSTTLNDALVLFGGLSAAELCVLPNCAHGAHMERPDLFNRAVAEFLASAQR